MLFEDKKIIWMEDKQKLRQAFTTGVEYAFVNSKNYQACPFVFCKDFLQDAIHARIINEKRGIHGFYYDPSQNKTINLNKTLILVANSEDVLLEQRMESCLDFIHQLEDKFSFNTKTKILKCLSPPLKYIRSGVFCFEASKRWIIAPPMISMYTLLIRVGLGHTIGQKFNKTLEKIELKEQKPYQHVDGHRIQHAIKSINYIISKGDKKIFGNKIKDNYPKHIKTSVMHNDLGIIGFSRKLTKNKMPQWFKEIT